MSTNFYASNEKKEVTEEFYNTALHIGKRCSGGIFIWAMRPEECTTIEEIVDEYGNKMTAEQFKEVLYKCPVHDTKHIGTNFS